MSMTRAKSFLSVVLVGAAATLGGTAQAAFYTGTWDPAYGGIFPNLGWKASALFDVPDACAAVGTGSRHFDQRRPCAGFDVLSARVDFYNVAAPGTILESFDLNPDVFVSGISLTDGKLTGVNTVLLRLFVPTLAIAGGGTYSFSLILFDGGLEQPDGFRRGAAGLSPTRRLQSLAVPQFPTHGQRSAGSRTSDAVGTFAPVPEPETYALMLAGLGALGFVARRRRSAVARRRCRQRASSATRRLGGRSLDLRRERVADRLVDLPLLALGPGAVERRVAHRAPQGADERLPAQLAARRTLQAEPLA